MGVYSAADSLSLHTRFTTKAVELSASDSTNAGTVGPYLDVAGLIRAAKRTGCEDGLRFVTEVPICGDFEPNMLAMLSTRDQPDADPDVPHYTVPTCATCGHGPTCGDHQGYLAILPADLD